MGAVACCNEMNSYKTENPHIYQINRYIKCSHKEEQILTDSQRETNTTLVSNDIKTKKYKKQYLKNKNGEFMLLSYDVEEELFVEFYIKFPIIKSIEGMSELTIDKKVYLCGISPKQKDQGSFLFQIDINNRNSENELQINAEVLINSQYTHIYPSLIHDENGKILCVGGKKQTYCELYNLNMNKWFTLPQLEEERYKCTLCLDAKENYVYLFGGINTDINKDNKENEDDEKVKILRMNLQRLLIWENLIVKNNSRNITINRISAGAFTFKFDEDFIFIVGGEDFEENCLDNVLRFSIKNLKFESTGIKLKIKNKAIFTNKNGVSINEQAYCLIDDFNNIHLIERHDCLPMDYHPDMI